MEYKNNLDYLGLNNNIFINSSSQASPFELFDQSTNDVPLLSNLNSLKEISFDNQNENQKSNEKSLEYIETQKILE